MWGCRQSACTCLSWRIGQGGIGVGDSCGCLLLDFVGGDLLDLLWIEPDLATIRTEQDDIVTILPP
jgi:hypothetical protein